jgi:multidrug efflux pump subunit AcrA (membrane-fusion protein)
LLKAGMYARVMLPTGDKQLALVVPKDALVLRQGSSPVVYVVEPATAEGKPSAVMPVPVQIGVSSGKGIQVTGNLKVGQLVAVEGNERIFGKEVTITRVLPAEPDPADSLSQSQ